MNNFGLKGVLLLLAVVLFIVGALMDTGDTKLDLQYWGLAVLAAAFLADRIPFGSMTGTDTREPS